MLVSEIQTLLTAAQTQFQNHWNSGSEEDFNLDKYKLLLPGITSDSQGVCLKLESKIVEAVLRSDEVEVLVTHPDKFGYDSYGYSTRKLGSLTLEQLTSVVETFVK